MTKLIRLLLVFITLFIGSANVEARTLKINIFSLNNGKGLEASRKVLTQALENLGHFVYEKELLQGRNNNEIPVDINLFLEMIQEEWIPYAKLNWFIPHPECYIQEISLLDKMDLILCLTHDGERIFQSLNKKTYFLGFTSLDCYNDQIPKDFSLALHVAGGSGVKGTSAIVDAWKNNELFPPLSIFIQIPFPSVDGKNLTWVTTRVSDSNLRYYQNHHGVHLCPSETESFGHYIVEAMSTKAVVITTDAPPMNEMITDKRCLVPYQTAAPFRQLGTRYFIDSKELEQIIENLLQLTHEELEQIGEENRMIYLQKTQEFNENLKHLMQSTSAMF